MVNEILIPDGNIVINDDLPGDVDDLRPSSASPYTSNSPNPQVTVQTSTSGIPVQYGDVSLQKPGTNIKGFKVSYKLPDGNVHDVEDVSLHFYAASCVLLLISCPSHPSYQLG